MKAAAVRHATCEKDFVLKSIRKGIRLDGRQLYDYRNVNVEFGVDYGCCEVFLGDTRVMAQTSCELVQPPVTRPMSGQLFINVELSPMASPAFENGRMSDFGIEVNRIIERCLKESNAIDVESLCLIANEKVWCIRVDVLVLNDSGNIVDCCCMAAISALANFRYPDVTVTGTEVIVHSLKEKQYVPLRVHHMPILNTFGFIDNGDQVILDPDEKEECILSGQLAIAFNIHNEVCCAQMSGGVSLDYQQIMQCAKIASTKATEIIKLIKAGLDEDKKRRLPTKVKRRPGLKDPTPKQMITKTVAESTKENLTEDANRLEDIKPFQADLSAVQPVHKLDKNTASIGEGSKSTWAQIDSSDEDVDHKPSLGETSYQDPTNIHQHKPFKENGMSIDLVDSDDEEDEVMLLSSDLENTTSKTNSPYVTEVIADDGNEENLPNANNRPSSKSARKKKKKKKKVPFPVTS